MRYEKKLRLLTNLIESSKKRLMVWGPNASKTGYIVKIDDIIVELDRRPATTVALTRPTGQPSLPGGLVNPREVPLTRPALSADQLVLEIKDAQGRIVDSDSEPLQSELGRALLATNAPDLSTLYDVLRGKVSAEDVIDKLIERTSPRG